MIARGKVADANIIQCENFIFSGSINREMNKKIDCLKGVRGPWWTDFFNSTGNLEFSIEFAMRQDKLLNFDCNYIQEKLNLFALFPSNPCNVSLYSCLSQ